MSPSKNAPIFCLILAMMSFLPCGCSQKQSFPNSNVDIGTELISDDFDVPWGLAFLPDGRMLVTERGGTLYVLPEPGATPQTVQGLPEVYVRGQGGLMDLELHPNYAENGWIYITYGDAEDKDIGGNTAVMRARLDGLTLVDQQEIFRAQPDTRKGQHWGGRVEFDRDGYLYVTVGDRGARDVNPQSLQNHCGKVHRLHDDGSIPDDNPFVGQDGAVESIFSYGHRNPQGMAMHPVTGDIWTHEHGPRGGDELNRVVKGNNYGWPVITYGKNYSGTKITDERARPGMEQPATYWIPSIAPCGMTFVTSDRYPQWKNHILVGSLRFNYLHLVQLDGNEVVNQEKVLDKFGRMRVVREAPDGFLYIGVEGKGIYKLVPE